MNRDIAYFYFSLNIKSGLNSCFAFNLTDAFRLTSEEKSSNEENYTGKYIFIIVISCRNSLKLYFVMCQFPKLYNVNNLYQLSK